MVQSEGHIDRRLHHPPVHEVLAILSICEHLPLKLFDYLAGDASQDMEIREIENVQNQPVIWACKQGNIYNITKLHGRLQLGPIGNIVVVFSPEGANGEGLVLSSPGSRTRTERAAMLG